MITEEYRVDGKVAIVTGAGRGIGKAIALTLGEAGADITAVARTREQIEQTAEDIRKLGRQALAIPTDVSEEDQVKKAVEQTISQFGKIDILVNNAGIAISKPVALVPGAEIAGFTGKRGGQDKQLTLQEWRKIIDTNLTSAFLFAQAVGPYMMKQRKGKVINTSSTCADEGLPRISAYSASKAGLSTFTRCLASEWGPFNINVNAIAPGVIRTDMVAHHLEDPKSKEAILGRIPLGRVAEPRDVALLVLFLASEASDYLTGQIFTIDGGAMGRGIGI
jgi:NAD(P)-dependent dehydrogenase (short-subunit alcohol dehydrogenase family)